GAEAIIDVYDGDTRGATIQHREQRGDALKRCAISHTRRNGDDRAANEPADPRRQRAVHSRDHDHHRGRRELVEFREDTMDPGDADVCDAYHAIAEGVECDPGLFRHGQVTRARGDDHDIPLATRRWLSAA